MVLLKDGREVDLVLYKFDSCPYCQRVLQAIDRLGIEIPTRDTRRDPDAARTLVETGGKRQVPCLFVEGKPLYESLDILRWLEENLVG